MRYRILAVLLGFVMVCILSGSIKAQEQPSATPESDPLPSYIDPQEIRRGVPMGGVPGKSRRQFYYEQRIEKVEPDLQGVPERLPVYINAYKQDFIVDSRLFPFDVQAEAEKDGAIRLTGYVGFEENRQALLQYLYYLGFKEIEDRIEVLPSRKLGKKMFAFAIVPHCFTYDRPGGRKEPMTEVLMGDPIYLLREGEEDMYLCHSSEGYVGFIHRDNIRQVDRKKFHEYQSGPQVSLIDDYRTDDLYIPIGSRLKWIRSQDDLVYAELPGGKKRGIPSGSVQILSGQVPEKIEKAIEIASKMVGTKYVWSGKTIEGVDCSGLIQSSFRAVGINMSRDAYQQSYMGSLVATRWYREGLRRGDTLYFLGSSGRIHHTAIYLGDGKYLEASGRDVHYGSFNFKDENYDERKDQIFCFGKRVLE